MGKKKETTTEVVEVKADVSLVPVNVEGLISQAIDKGIPVDTMERLLTMRTQLKTEWAKEQFNKAMANFQAECPQITKTKEVKTKSGIVAYRYAPIESIVQQVAPFLKTNGFSYSTSMELKEAGVKVIVRVVHVSGHSEESSMEVPFGNKTEIMSASQVTAAAQTLAKRYAVCNAFGILTGDEDTDARPVAPETEPAKPKETEKSYKNKIFYLCELLTFDTTSKESIERDVLKATNLTLKEVNYPEIVSRLEDLVQKQKKESSIIRPASSKEAEEEINAEDIPF